jgi:pimeloyl-ACP methyl ester carboxylesterase
MIGKISMQSHLVELAGAVETLLKEPDVDKNSLFVLTSSEGTIHALNYQMQAKTKFKGLILTGAPGRSVGEVARTKYYTR